MIKRLPLLPNKVAIIILTWNGIDYTKSCLESIKNHGIPKNTEIIVVDNGSSDGTVAYLQSQRWIKTILNGKNLGFTAGNNVALNTLQPKTDAILLNNDVEIIDATWVEKLHRTVYRSSSYGIAGCRIRRVHGDMFQHGGTYMPDILFQGIQIGGGEKDINQYNRDVVVEGVVFACAYIKSEVLQKIGALDEDYFAYYEDTDYCLKAKAAGFDSVMCGSLTVLHHENVSTGINKVNFSDLYLQSKKIFLSKWKNFLDDRFSAEINLITTFTVPIGYATSAKLLAKSLELAGVKVRYRFAYGINSVVPVDEPDEFNTGDNVTNIIRSRQTKKSIPNLFYCQADAFAPLPGEYNIGFSMLETTGVPASWVDGCNLMDEVWVPTPFNAWTFRRSGVTKPIKIVPLGLIDTHYFNEEIRSYPMEDFTFLSIFEWGERKAPEVLIRAFNQTFRADDPVVLICKYVNGDPGVVPTKIIEGLNLDPNGGRIVFSENERVPYYQISQLYRSADCFVLPTRGEGWGMPILEAMGCGLPVIASYWSGQQYFMNDNNSYPLQVSLVPAVAKCPYYDGFQWADPDELHLRQLLRHVYEHQDEAQQKGHRAAIDTQTIWDVSLMGHRVADQLASAKRPSRTIVPVPSRHIAIDISRTIGEQVTGVGRYTLRLLEGLAEMPATDIDFDFELIPGFAEYTHPEYLTKYDYQGPRSPHFTVHRGPTPSFSDIDHFVPGMSLVHCTSNVVPAFLDTPTLFTVYDLTFLTHREHHTPENVDLCVRNFERAVTQGVHFTPISHHSAADLIRYFNVPENRISVVECGVSPDQFRPPSPSEIESIRSRYALPDRYFLYVGSLEPRKNLKTLLRAMALYKGREKLVVAGAAGWKNNDIIKGLEVDGNVIFLNYVPDEDLPALYGAALAFIYPSLYEGFGFPVIEAMACGVPVITSNNSSLAEIATGAALLLTEPEDEIEILKKLMEVAQDNAVRHHLAKVGLANAKKYSTKTFATKMLALYASMISH